MSSYENFEIWFITGSQHLYGEKLEEVRKIAKPSSMDSMHKGKFTTKIAKPIVTELNGIKQACLDANAAPECLGIITWMHTFTS